MMGCQMLSKMHGDCKYDPTDAVKEAKNGYLNIENYALSLEYPDEYEYELNKNKQ